VKYKEDCDSFVQTRTGNGDSILTAIEADFENIYSFEQNEENFEIAQRRFLTRSCVSLFRGEPLTCLDLFLSLFSSGSLVVFLNSGTENLERELITLRKFKGKKVVMFPSQEDSLLMSRIGIILNSLDLLNFSDEDEIMVAYGD
jgi:hypothetical protein